MVLVTFSLLANGAFVFYFSGRIRAGLTGLILSSSHVPEPFLKLHVIMYQKLNQNWNQDRNQNREHRCCLRPSRVYAYTMHISVVLTYCRNFNHVLIRDPSYRTLHIGRLIMSSKIQPCHRTFPRIRIYRSNLHIGDIRAWFDPRRNHSISLIHIHPHSSTNIVRLFISVNSSYRRKYAHIAILKVPHPIRIEGVRSPGPRPAAVAHP